MLKIPKVCSHKLLANKDEVTVVLVGESKVGKSSIVATYANDRTPDPYKILSVIPTVCLPPQLTGLTVPLSIIDTSSKQNLEKLQRAQQIKKADVICLVFDVSNMETFNKLSAIWIPEITSNIKGNKMPSLILIGNKCDLLPPGSSDSQARKILYSQIKKLTSKYKIDKYIECSAKNGIYLKKIFEHCIECIISPKSALIDNNNKLTDAYISALSNIFNMLDYNRSGYLNKQEAAEYLKLLYPKVENAYERIEENLNNVLGDEAFHPVYGISLIGFIGLHHQFVIRSKISTLWNILHIFGYNGELILSYSFLSIPVQLKKGESVELSQHGIDFLTDVFERFDRNKDGFLDISELKQLFLTAPADPFHLQSQDLVEGDPNRGISLKGFIALWRMQCYVDVAKLLRYFRYFGYLEKLNDVIAIIPPKNKLEKKIYCALLVGSTKCGKTTFMKSWLRQASPNTNHYHPTAPNSFPYVKSISPDDTSLIIREITEADKVELFTKDRINNLHCDIICLMYDINDVVSFSYVSKLYEELLSSSPSIPPSVFLSSKTNIDSPQKTSSWSAQFCRKYGLIDPLNASIEQNQMNDTIQSIVSIAKNPKLSRKRTFWKTVLKVGVVIGIVGVVSLGGLYLYSKNSKRLGGARPRGRRNRHA